MAGYVYRGTERDAHLPIEEQKKKLGRIPGPRNCGTRSGYVTHRKKKEPACQPCKDANQAYSIDYNERVANRQIKKGWTDEKCGTLAGYKAHYRHAMPMCEPCRQANRDRCRESREAKRAA